MHNKHILLKFASLLPKQNQLKFGFCLISCKIWNYGLQSARFELIDLNTRGRSSGYIFSFICWLLKKPFVDRSQSSFKSCLTPTGKSNYKWQIRPQRSTKQTRRGRNPGSRHGPVRNKERTKKFPKLCYRLRDRVWPKTESKRRTQTQLSTETWKLSQTNKQKRKPRKTLTIEERIKKNNECIHKLKNNVRNSTCPSSLRYIVCC